MTDRTEQLVKERDGLKYDLEVALDNLAYLTSCTAATAEGFLGRKATPKNELERHASILGNLIKSLDGEYVARASATIVGARSRAIRAKRELEERLGQ